MINVGWCMLINTVADYGSEIYYTVKIGVISILYLNVISSINYEWKTDLNVSDACHHFYFIFRYKWYLVHLAHSTVVRVSSQMKREIEVCSKFFAILQTQY